MIPYHFEIKSGKRGTSVDHVNYLTRMGNHAQREDLLMTESGNMPVWSDDDPKTYFKASDKYERKNAAPFRSMTFSLPNVLTDEQNKKLAHDITHALVGKKPFLLAVHAPISSLAGEIHPHGHVMVSDRIPDGIERSSEQTFRRFNRTSPEKGGCEKDSGGRNRMGLRDWVIAQRKIVADKINEALVKHGHHDRVDHRTLREQGERRQPEPRLGPARIRRMSASDKTRYVEARRDQHGSNAV